ncbi:hypothetical protein [Phenylobacterium sp. SCN 70-31]|uniref:SMP-30/gluconolactonase/LRE family protein n=1 Tax=Phenylobacterium sp. SCN 70-31 TaxID=1660129 RepID=UPI00086C88BC|nr:hypothetical protein [Phenylobacterium sp. SCN 70-31]ODT85900.1 MAG: hypothetical protein ABS78_18340 [Phenylobacterium sp. SCN 70-31]
MSAPRASVAAALFLTATSALAAEPAVEVLAADERRDLLIEGVAHHQGQWFVSAVAARTIFRIEDGRLAPFLQDDPATGGVFGLAVDARRGVLWAAEAWGDGVPGGSGGKRTGLLEISLADGRILARHPAPAPATTFGDVVVDPAGAVYASDSATGAVWVLAPGAAAPRLVGKPEGATSAQGMVLCPLDAMIVSDYRTGLHRLDLADGTSRPVKAEGRIAGLDGLVSLRLRDTLDVAATYNGREPYRLLRLRISADCERLEAVESVLAGEALPDPALAAVAPGGLVVVTRSQWAGWTAEGTRNGVDPGPATVAFVRLAPLNP